MFSSSITTWAEPETRMISLRSGTINISATCGFSITFIKVSPRWLPMRSGIANVFRPALSRSLLDRLLGRHPSALWSYSWQWLQSAIVRFRPGSGHLHCQLPWQLDLGIRPQHGSQFRNRRQGSLNFIQCALSDNSFRKASGDTTLLQTSALLPTSRTKTSGHKLWVK